MKFSFTSLSLLLLLAGITSCKKKLDVSYDNRINPEPTVLSSTRLVSLADATELEINGQRLTSFMLPDREGAYNGDQTRATLYFPETGRLGTTFTIPLQFVDAAGNIPGIRFSSLSPKVYAPAPRNFQAKNDYNNPRDYYHVRFTPNKATLTDSLFEVPRSVSPSANPGYCKVRLLNLSSSPDQFRSGAFSVAFSNGEGIPGLQNIAPGAYSDYVEMPFGAYQFRVLDASGRQLPAKGSTASDVYILNTQTGTLLGSFEGTSGQGGFRDAWLTYAPLKTYQPGGIYTIVVASGSSYSIPMGGPGETLSTFTNTFQVISDISEPVNQTYARVQAVNVIPGKELKWQVDGKALGNTLSFTAATSYDSYIIGKHQVKALDAQGAVIAEAELSLSPGDNITAWAYTQKSGQTAITFSANNLSTRYYAGTTGNDGSYAMLQDFFPHWVRFMNFCLDLDEVSFTANNGQAFQGKNNNAALHIQMGKPVVIDPYVRMLVNNSSSVMAYASKPDVLPGDWLTNVSSLKSTEFITSPGMYSTTPLPNSEPGIYTVVLVGSTKADAPAAGKARMIILKHNQ